MTCPEGRVRAIGKRNGFFLAFLFPIALFNSFKSLKFDAQAIFGYFNKTWCLKIFSFDSELLNAFLL